MARNGSGGYSLPVNTWNPATNGVSATAADYQALINDLAAAVQQSISADGQTPVTGSLNMGGNRLTGLSAGNATGHSLRFEQLFSQGLQQDIAAAATVDIGAGLSVLVNVTGTGAITSFGTNYNGPRYLRFAGVCTLTNSATLVLPGGGNITTAAGDSAIVVPLGNPATGWRVAGYERAAGLPAMSGANTDITSLGAVTGVTATLADNTNKLATTAFVIANAPVIADASETVAGKVEFADGTESVSATNNNRALSPLRLREALNATGIAPIFACRAWVNFNGTGTPSIRNSGNVSSITDNGTGDYTVNFNTAVFDANFSAVCSCSDGSNTSRTAVPFSFSGSSVRIGTKDSGFASFDASIVTVAIFR